MDTSIITTPKYITFFAIFLLKSFDIRYAAETNRYTGNTYSLKPMIPKKNPDIVLPTIPHIRKFARSKNSENAKSTINITSLLSCFCLAASASLAFLSIAAFERAEDPERPEFFDLAADPDRPEAFGLAADPERPEAFDPFVDFAPALPDEVFVFDFLFSEAILYLFFHSSSKC